MIDDATVFRLGDDNFRFVGGCESDGLLLAERARELGLRAWVKPVTDDLHNLAVQGPASREALARIVWSSARCDRTQRRRRRPTRRPGPSPSGSSPAAPQGGRHVICAPRRGRRAAGATLRQPEDLNQRQREAGQQRRAQLLGLGDLERYVKAP